MDMVGQATGFPDRRFRQILYFALSVVFLGLMVRGPLSEREKAVSGDEYREAVLEAYEELLAFVMQKQDEKKPAEKFGDVPLSGKEPDVIRQVDEDQHWINGNSYGDAEAVYMVDGTGTLVYFSYHDLMRATTWSGPSTDAEFLAAHGGWNGGNGSGWTGYKLK